VQRLSKEAIVALPDDGGLHTQGKATLCDAPVCEQLRTEVRFLQTAIARLEAAETPLTVRGALLAIFCAKTSDAWTGAFEHLGGRRLRMWALLDALDAHYGFRSVSAALDPDAVKAVSSETAAMVILPFAVDLFNALLAIAHQRDLVLRLTRGSRGRGEGSNLPSQIDTWPPAARYRPTRRT
jgi:hypothetical protein